MEKPIVRRRRARQDVDDAIDFYMGEAGAEVAYRFVDALEGAYHSIRRHPETGSPRYAEIAGKEGLRGCALKRFPYVVIYMVSADRIEVWRVLHMRRDIPASFQD